MQSEIDILRDVSEKLAGAGIPFMLTGSVALSYYAIPRMTRDIDIVVSLGPAEAKKFFELFASEYYVAEEAVSDAIRRGSMFNIIHFESVIKVDLILLRKTAFAVSAFSRRANLVLEGFQTSVISREDLILSKLAWARDTHSEIQLRDVRNLLSPDCDFEYLRHWASDLSVTETLDSLLDTHE